jgi:hypothetical protein
VHQRARDALEQIADPAGVAEVEVQATRNDDRKSVVSVVEGFLIFDQTLPLS